MLFITAHELLTEARTVCHTRLDYYQQKTMDDGRPPDDVEPNKDQDKEGDGLDWLLEDGPEIAHVPMDTNVLLSR